MATRASFQTRHKKSELCQNETAVKGFLSGRAKFQVRLLIDDIDKQSTMWTVDFVDSKPH